MADTRAVLVGTGVVLVILGFLFSTVVCGVGFLFIILGLVIWQREEDDTADYTAKTSSGFAGTGRPRRGHRGRLVVVVAIVLAAAFGGYLFIGQLAPVRFTGVRISAPNGECWSGTVGSGGSSSGTIVGSCGSTDYPLTCASTMWVDLAKSTPGNWTLAVSGYHDGTFLGTDSASTNLGVVRGNFTC